MKKLLHSLLFLAITAVASAQNYVVQLQSGAFLPQEKSFTSALPKEELVNGRYYRFIQFYQIPTDEQKRTLLAKGITLYNYVPNYSFMASLPGSLNVATLNEPNIRSILPISPVNKFTQDLATKKYPDFALRGHGKIELIVVHHPDVASEQAAAALKMAGGEIVHVLEDQNAFRVIVNISAIEKIAHDPHFYFIEPADGDPQPDNLVGRTDHRSNMIATEYAGGLKYDGTGVSVALNDDGVIGPHIDYTGRIINQFISFNNGNHGDHCAGTIFGAGNRNPTTKGMAFGANLGVYGVGGSFANYYQAFDSIYNHYNKHNIRITSTSYSDGNNAGYTTRARLMDIHMNSMNDLIHVFSAGNAGTSNYGYGAGAGWGNITGGHKQAKNVIAVGNLSYDDALNSSSSRGPAKDGRIKPDICAVGTNVNSTINPDVYQQKTGTSMSCPGVAGTVAQLYHAYKSLNNGANPPSALIKAAVLNTGDDIGNPGPDYKHGYGRINARRALGILQNNQYLLDSISQGATKTHTISVPSNVAELRVMIYWHDKEATAGVSKALVNNINMSVATPSSSIVNPWVLNPTPNATVLNSNAVQGIDTLNNVEQVTIPNPATGNYTVNVNGFAIPTGPQKYVVVYEFVMNQITVVYPSGGESIVPALQEVIRWDAYGNTGNFTLQYSTNNGASWTNISTNVSGSSRYFNWTPPSTVTGQALVRVSRGTLSDQSDAPFSIIGVPSGLTVDWVCIDSMKVSYTAISGATGYVVSVLGTQYMDSVGFSTTTSCIVKGINTLTPGWFSVHAIGANDCKGRRALAQTYSAVPFNCIIADDLGVVSFTSPSEKSIINCQSTPITEQVAIQIKNNGLAPLNNISVKYTVNGGVPVVDAFNGSIPPQTTVTHTFSPSISFPAPGSYQIKAWVENLLDLTPVNDTIAWMKDIVQPPTMTLPFYADFENFNLCDTSANCETEQCIPIAGWRNERNGVDDDIDWRISSGPTPTGNIDSLTGPLMDLNPGIAIGKYAYLEATNCYGKQANLVLPCIDLSGSANPKLVLGYHMFGSGTGSLHVDVLSNGVWINDVLPALIGNQGNNWQYATVGLGAYTGQIISLRIRGLTGTNEESDIAIDDISVVDATSLSSLSFENSVQVFPNPSDGIYNVSFSKTQSSTDLKVVDISGRLAYNTTIQNGQDATIDLRGKAAGIYVLTIKSVDGVITKRLIKH
ncbi:MAG TPA: S8 family serine peptidase [Flavipsychrobacter sp.]|nr:S8 family serine peptidase [Flavipsychrobacter sp.]